MVSTLTYLPSLEVALTQTLLPVSSDPLLVRITSSGIKASTLVTGSILSNFYFFLSLCNLSQVCVLFCYSHSCLRLVAFLFAFLFLFLFLFLSDSVSKIMFEFCFQILFGNNLAYWKNLGV